MSKSGHLSEYLSALTRAAIGSDDSANAARLEKVITALSKQEQIEPELASDLETLKKYLMSWKQSLKVGDYIDILEGTVWYQAKIKNILENGFLDIHYLGWKDNTDQIVDGSRQILPYATITIPKRAATAKLSQNLCPPSLSSSTIVEASSDQVNEKSCIDGELAEKVGPESSSNNDAAYITYSKSGRIIRLTQPQVSDNATKQISKRSRDCEKHSDGVDDVTEETSRQRDKDKNDWFCSHCMNTVVEGSDSPLVMCDGPCLRSFHDICLKYLKDKDRKKFYDEQGKSLCWDCKIKQFECFSCGSKKCKKNNKSVAVKCKVGTCGKHYHGECLEMPAADTHIAIKVSWVPQAYAGLCSTSPAAADAGDGASPTEVRESQTSAKKKGKKRAIDAPVESPAVKAVKSVSGGKAGEGEKGGGSPAASGSMNRQGMVPSFRCPYHYCDSCSDHFNDQHTRSANKGLNQLGKCIACPRAFHTNCILPSARFNSRFLVCDRHPELDLPDVTDNGSSSRDFDRLLEAVWKELSHEQQEFVEDEKEKRKIVWDHMVLPESMPDPSSIMANHFVLPTKFQDDVMNEPKTFKSINKLVFDSLPGKEKAVPTYPAEETCSCTAETGCKMDCINRILKIECCEDVCNVGPQCGNRSIQNRKYAKTERFREYGMGWGLRAAESITHGSLVIEYIGEVIDTEQMRTRMADQRRFSPADHDFYIMELDTGIYVDGKHQGNESRFINHSCEPNCELQRWVVKGRIHIGIMALYNIPAGEALSYDYQFDTNEEGIFKCNCGKDACRGTMAPKKKVGAPQLTVSQRRALIKLGKKQVDERTEEQKIQAELQRSYTGKLLPGDPLLEVKNGPHRSAVVYAQEHKLLLARSLRRGTHFLKRRKQMWLKSVDLAVVDELKQVAEAKEEGKEEGKEDGKVDGKVELKIKAENEL